MSRGIQAIKDYLISFTPPIQKQCNRVSAIATSAFASTVGLNYLDAMGRLMGYTFEPSTSWAHSAGQTVIKILMVGAGLGTLYVYLTSEVFRLAVKVIVCTVLLRKIQNWTLQWACHKGYAKLARALIFIHADVNAKNFFHNLAPLHYASSLGHSKVVQILIDAGANPALGGGRPHILVGRPFHRLPIKYAIVSGDIETIKILHQYTPVEFCDLYPAVRSGNENVVN